MSGPNRQANTLYRNTKTVFLAGTSSVFTYLDTDGATTITLTNNDELDATTTTVAVTITNNSTLNLAAPSDMLGQFVSISNVGATANTLTLSDNALSYDWSTNLTLDATDDGVLLYSDGRKWWIVTNDIS